MLQHFICETCGSQFNGSEKTPDHCPVCEDERQYVNWNGQQWTTLESLKNDHHNIIRKIEPGIYGICTEPKFAIGQQALLIQTSQGNILWDCLSLLDDKTIDEITQLGGISAIAISHPHYYSSMVEWSHAFNAPVYLHDNDKQWIMRTDPSITLWNGATHLLNDSCTLICCGGHFEGATVLHWKNGAHGKGILFTGDTIKVAMDRRYVSFMRSYPNHLPLNASAVRNIVVSVAPFEFDRIYGAWHEHTVQENAKEVVRKSAERYISAISG